MLLVEKLKELWVIPIWFTIVTVISMVVGRMLGWLFGLQQSQRCVQMELNSSNYSLSCAGASLWPQLCL